MLDGGRKVRRDYFDAVQQLEPVDAIILEIIALRPMGPDHNAAYRFIEQKRIGGSVSSDDYEISLEKLERLGCIRVKGIAGPPILAAFGRGLRARACGRMSTSRSPFQREHQGSWVVKRGNVGWVPCGISRATLGSPYKSP